MKRILNVFIVIFILPIYVFASSSDEARINDVYYSKLEDAINEVKEGEVIYLLSNVKLDSTYLIDKSVIIKSTGNRYSSRLCQYYYKWRKVCFNGKDKTPTNSFNNGVNPTGVVLQIESNNSTLVNSFLISGGIFSSDVSSYLKSNYKLNKVDNEYRVLKVSGSVLLEEDNKKFPIYAYILLIFGVVIIVGYFIKKYYVKNKSKLKYKY